MAGDREAREGPGQRKGWDRSPGQEADYWRVSASVEVKPSYGLSDSEIETMLRDSMAHAEDDMHARALREQQVEAGRVIEALQNALASDGGELLSPGERERIDEALRNLIEAAKGSDQRLIKNRVEELENTCGFYVERRMNRSVHDAMAGHKVDEFE